jgi:alpha-D-ribose 1-methylphosphonate 5-triphosphate synthase subunit PhnL
MSRACYRLKMVDFDGKFKYSAVMMVAFGTVAIDVRPTILSAGEAVRVNLAGANAAKYDVRLFDLGGRMIQQKNQVSGQVQLETSLLKKGIYILSITDGVTQNAYRVTVQ